VDLLGVDYTIDGLFCEILAISHSMTLRLDVHNKIGNQTDMPPVYEKKFADFIRLCEEAKRNGVQKVIVAAHHREVLEKIYSVHLVQIG
jgi:hypothetical protein